MNCLFGRLAVVLVEDLFAVGREENSEGGFDVVKLEVVTLEGLV